MADQTVSLELTGDADDLIAAVQESGAAMEELADAGTQSAAEIEQAMSGQESMWERNAGAIEATGAAAAAAGVAFEGLARSQQDNRAVAGRLANRIEGETTDSIMGLAAELHNATTDMDSLVHAMEVGGQQGLETGAELQEFASFWDMVADATGESHDALTDASIALRAVGVDAGRESEALGAFGFIAEETTGSVGEFLQFIERTGPELRDLGADVDDAAAIMGVLEQEFGMSGRTARQEFRSAIGESDGTLQGLLDTLGVGPEVFADYRGAVDESTGVIEANAQAFADSRTFTQELQADVEALAARFSGVTDAASNIAPVLTGAGGAAWGLSQLQGVIGGVRTGLSKMVGSMGKVQAATRTIGFAGAAAGALFLADMLADARREASLYAEEVAGGFSDPERQLSNVRAEIEVLQDIAGKGVRLDLGDSIALFSSDEAKTAQNQLDALEDKAAQLELQISLNRDAASELGDTYVDVSHALDSGLNPAEAHHAIKMQEAAAAAGESEDAVAGAGDAYDDTADQTLTAAEAIDEYIAANRRATDPVFRLMDAISKVDDAQQAYNDAVDKYGAESSEASDAAINLMQRVQDLEAAAIDGELSFAEFEGQLNRWVEDGRITAEQAAAIRDRVAEARGEADQFEGTRNMVLNASGNAWDRIARINRQVAALPRNVQIRAEGGMEFRAEGGPVAPGQPYVVGEEGPELVTFGQRGMVHDTDTTRQMLGPTPDVDTRLLEQLISRLDSGRTLTVQQTFAGDVGRTTLAEARHQQRLAFLEAV